MKYINWKTVAVWVTLIILCLAVNFGIFYLILKSDLPTWFKDVNVGEYDEWVIKRVNSLRFLRLSKKQ